MKTKYAVVVISSLLSLSVDRAVGTTIPTPPAPGYLSPTWTGMEDCTYAMRRQFYNGLRQLEVTVDKQMTELVAKRATLGATAKSIDRIDWDLAIKELGRSRSYLQAAGEELKDSAPDEWDQEKDKVGQAWARTQADCQQAILSLSE
ncbi:MAG: hypothetical protein ABSE59_11320 [Opitutaceae bacterium]|jgi:hypothetical protein